MQEFLGLAYFGSLEVTDFDPTRLELEVTESTLLGNVDTAELAMLRLKALGVRLDCRVVERGALPRSELKAKRIRQAGT